MNFEQARDTQWTWKTGEIVKAQVALVEAGLDNLRMDCPYFGPDDIPESVAFGGQGIVGSALAALRNAGLITDCWLHAPQSGIVHGRRRSRRPAANGRKVNLYTLTSRALAEAFVARHKPVERKQMELAF